MNFDERTRFENERDYNSTDRTELCGDYNTSYDDIVKADEPCAKESQSGGKWKPVVIGGSAGILMGAAGAFAGNAAISGMDFSSDNDEPMVVEDEDLLAADEAQVVESADSPMVNDVDGELAAAEVPTFDNIGAIPAVNDDMSFADAFAEAREDLGPGGLFVWHGNVYNTYYAEEWNAMSPAAQEAFADSASRVTFPPIAGDDGYEMAYEPDSVGVYVDETDDDVHILGVYEENIDGQNMYIGEVEIDGENVVLVDGDQDGLFDVLIADVDGDGVIGENDFVDISSDGITVSDLAAEAESFVDDNNGTLAYNDSCNDTYNDPYNDSFGSSDMPDYMNDADVSMC